MHYCTHIVCHSVANWTSVDSATRGPTWHPGQDYIHTVHIARTLHNIHQMAPNVHSATHDTCTIFSTLFAHTHISALFDTPMHAKRINVHHNMHSLYTIRSTIGHNMECTTYVHLCILFSTLCAQYHTIHPFCTPSICTKCVHIAHVHQ